MTRLHDSKGNSYLVEAARLVLNERPQAKFFIVGEGPLREPLEQQARALGLGDRFVFAGFARDVARVVSAFDLSVFPSLWEGTPLTVFEALAMGKPIVATDADGLLDVLSDDRDALIVPKRERRGAGARDRPADRRAGDAGAPRRRRARVSGRQYDIAAFVRKMERLYDLLHRVSRATHRKGAVQADLSFLDPRLPAVAREGTGMTREPAPRLRARRRPPRRRCVPASFRPGAVLALVLLCVYGGLALSVDFPRAAIGYPERRGDLLHDGAQPRARRRPDLPPRGSGARLARVSERARPACS